MALPTSGQLKISMLQTEFGGGNSLKDYYRGGALVPNVSTNYGVPTSGQIKLTHFYGATGTTALKVSISGGGYKSDQIQPYSTTSTLNANASSGSGTKSYSWTKVSGYTFSLSGTNTATMSATVSGSSGGMYSATYQVTVSDSTGSASDSISITHEHGTSV